MKIGSLCKKNSPTATLALCLSLSLSACGGGSGGGGNSSVVTPPPPVANRAPQISSPDTVSVYETSPVEVQISASDPENNSLSYALQSGADISLFSIDQHGVISATTQNKILDFEKPSDSDGDNVYKLNVLVSDGTNEVIQNLSIIIDNVGDELTCSSPETIIIPENTSGDIYTFKIEDPELDDFHVDYSPFEITKNGSNEVIYNTGGYVSRGNINGFRGTYTVNVFEYFNAEAQEDLNDIFTFSFTATSRESSVLCSLDFQIKDIPNEVKSGVKISDNHIYISDVKDIDGDGLSEVWIASQIPKMESPPAHEARLVFGKYLNADLIPNKGIEKLLRNFDASNSVRLYGFYPAVAFGRYVGNDLHASSVKDMDGDGLQELLITLYTPPNARDSAFADRPLAYLIWGESLANQADGEINLNKLLPSEGIIFDGLGGIDRRNNLSTSGDFDGDDISDIIIGVPSGEIQATETSVYTSPAFVVFGDFILQQKEQGVGHIDLLEDLNTLDPNESVVLLNERTILNDEPLPPESTFFASASQITVLENPVPGEADNLQQISGSQRQHFARMSILDGSVIKSAKGKTAYFKYEDVPIEKRTILTFKGTPEISKNTGDVDGDGKTDLMIGRSEYLSDNGFADLFYGVGLEKIPSGKILEIEDEYANLGFVRFTSNGRGNIGSQGYFLDDLDNDGRDDIVISSFNFLNHKPEEDAVQNTSVVVLLATALDDLPKDRLVNVDEIEPGQGIRIINGEMSVRGPEVTGLDDIDNDGLSDLVISTSEFGKEAYIVLGADILEMINRKEVILDLDKEFRTGE